VSKTSSNTSDSTESKKYNSRSGSKYNSTRSSVEPCHVFKNYKHSEKDESNKSTFTVSSENKK
jgi:hypothetical protein